MTNILEYLEHTVTRLPDKVALQDEKSALTFSQIYDQARSVGSYLHSQGLYKKPVVVFMHKSVQTIAAFFGTIYAGCYYVPLDDEMPQHRIDLILKTLNPSAVICDETTKPMMESYDCGCDLYLYQDICTPPHRQYCVSFHSGKTAGYRPHLYRLYLRLHRGAQGCHCLSPQRHRLYRAAVPGAEI